MEQGSEEERKKGEREGVGREGRDRSDGVERGREKERGREGEGKGGGDEERREGMDAGEKGGKEEGDRAREDERRERGACKRDGLLIVFLYICITCT